MEYTPSSAEVLGILSRTHKVSASAAPERITPAGSGRLYWRVPLEDKSTIIVMFFEKDRPENSYFAHIGLFLNELNIPTPRIWGDYTEEGWLVVEDVGDVSLRDAVGGRFDSNHAPSLKLYQDSLRAVKLLHEKGTQLFHLKPFTLMHGFDESVYLWETNYFWKNCLFDRLQLVESAQPVAPYAEEFQQLADGLSKFERVLIHRDFQSHNVQVRQGQVHLIDFQGMRFGLPEYDLASLLYDPYVSIQEADRQILLDYYSLNTFRPGGPRRKIFLQCAAQRLMQACGAYGFLSLQKGKTEYLQYIPTGLERLKVVLEELDEQKNLQQLLKCIPNLAQEIRAKQG